MSQGPFLPTSVTTSGSDIAWADKDNIKVAGSGYATATTNVGGPTNVIAGSGFGFTIEADAKITGILMTVYRKANFNDTRFVMDDSPNYGMELIKHGGTRSSRKFDLVKWATIDEGIFYGGAGDLWGTTWTVADINGSNFGFSYQTVLNTLVVQLIASIDYVTIQVDYTLPSVMGVQSMTAISTITF